MNLKKTKIIAILLSCLLVLALAAGCTRPAVTTSAPQTTSTTQATAVIVNVADMKGRAIQLAQPAERIIALTASDCEIIYAIGAGSTLIGRGEYCDYPQEINNVPVLKSGAETNIEQIIALKPEVVIMSTMAQTDEQVTALEKAGIKVVVSDARNIAGVYDAIRLIGAVTGKTDAAANLVSQMKATFDSVTAKAAKATASNKTIYFEVSPLEFGLWTAGNGTFMDEMAKMLGLTNAFADVQGWGEITQEQVIQRNPDFIVTIAMYMGQGIKPVDEILGRAGWNNMKAVQNRTILNADSNSISRPGPRLADAVTTLYDFVFSASSNVK